MAQRRKKRRTRSRGPAGGAQRPPDDSGRTNAYPGARVARVAVDDETWAAFRELCGQTPASVRLGDLVRADVVRAAGRDDPAVDALEALHVIGDQARELESYVRRLSGRA